MRRLVFVFLLLAACQSGPVSPAPAPPPSSSVTVRYASATGTGAAPCTASARCPVATALAAAVSGDVVELLGGTMTAPVAYRGSSAMINPPIGKSGQEDRPITVRCSVDGGCLLDGQFQRIPIRLARKNNWWVVEGINAKNGSGEIVSLRGSNNIVRRVVAWDNPFNSPRNGTAAFSCYSPGVNNLFEDVAGFGMGTWIFSHSQNKAGPCTFRRAWARFEGTAHGANGGAAFGGLFYKARSTTCDNCIGEFRANTGLTSFTVVTPTATSETGCPNATCTDGAPPIPNGPINQNRWIDPGDPLCNTDQTLCNMDGYVGGSFFYVQSDANLSRMTNISAPAGGALMVAGTGRSGGQMTFKDVLWFVHPSHAQFANIRALNLNERLFSTDMFLTNVSTVAGAANVIDTVDSSGNGTSGVWVTTNLVHASGLAGLNAASANPWTGTTGANLCYRYVNRVRQDGTGGTTVQPLWPWPMNARIKAATASAGAYSGPCQDCVGTFPTRTGTDVTAIIEELLGPIPASCRQSTSPSNPQGLKLTRPVEARSLLTKILYAPTR